MTRPPDMLRFLGGPLDGSFECAWTGPWPPPEYMTLAIGTESGIIRVVPPDFDLGIIADAPSIVVQTYALRSASTLPDDLDHPHIFRGAEYVPDEAIVQ